MVFPEIESGIDKHIGCLKTLKSEIMDYSFINSEYLRAIKFIEEKRNESTRIIENNQLQIEKILQEKDNYADLIENEIKDIAELSKFINIDEGKYIYSRVESELSSLKKDLADQILKEEGDLSERISNDVLSEFRPYLEKAKRDHEIEKKKLEHQTSETINRMNQEFSNELHSFISQIRINAQEELQIILNKYEKGNMEVLKKLENRHTKDIEEFEAAIASLNRKIEKDISEIKKQRIEESESIKKRFLRQIEEYRNEVEKERRRIRSIDNIEPINNDRISFMDAEISNICEKEYEEEIKKHASMLNSEIEEFLNQLNLSMNQSLGRRIEEYRFSIDKYNQEIDELSLSISNSEKTLMRLKKYEERHIQRNQSLDADKNLIQSDISNLKNRLMTIPSSIESKQHTIALENAQTCCQIKGSIQEIKSTIEIEEETHQALLLSMEDRHNEILRKTKKKTEAIIKSKDLEILDLTKKLNSIQLILKSAKF